MRHFLVDSIKNKMFQDKGGIPPDQMTILRCIFHFFRLLVGVCIYFVGGVIYMHFVRHTQGIEKIPHHLFWIGFPGLVKVGDLFSYIYVTIFIK